MWAEGRARTCPRTARGATPRAPCTRRNRAHTSAARVAPAWTRAHSQEVGTQALPPPTPSGGRGSGRAPGRSGIRGAMATPLEGGGSISPPQGIFPCPSLPTCVSLSLSISVLFLPPTPFLCLSGFPPPLGPCPLGRSLGSRVRPSGTCIPCSTWELPHRRGWMSRSNLHPDPWPLKTRT